LNAANGLLLFLRMATPSLPSWFCAQIGAREHYAIPRALHQTGRLTGLYTDFWAGPLTRSLLPRHGALGALASRFHPDLAGAEIKSWNFRALAWEAGLRRGSREDGIHNTYSGFIEVGRKFASVVRDQLRRRAISPKDTVFFAYDTGALETFEWLHEHGITCVLDQMDPSRIEVNLVREEEKRWPGWVVGATEVPEEYFRRREQEWALADRVVVNSEFSRQALIRQGVPADKLTVIPLCYESGFPREDDRRAVFRQPPLKVLFLGRVILRKGIQHLMEAAKLLRAEPVHFDVVGPIGISHDAVKSAPPNMTFHGRANRDQAGAWYQQADIFVLPTLSDGFALTQIEAMAHGLPVIATPNCGEVVTDGADGFIVPPRDAISLAKAVHRYLVEPELLIVHRVAALKKSEQFKLGHLVEKILSLEAELRR
jgi:glycosyltransferase involved in cell wall biosynthesis